MSVNKYGIWIVLGLAWAACANAQEAPQEYLDARQAFEEIPVPHGTNYARDRRQALEQLAMENMGIRPAAPQVPGEAAITVPETKPALKLAGVKASSARPSREESAELEKKIWYSLGAAGLALAITGLALIPGYLAGALLWSGVLALIAAAIHLRGLNQG